MRSRSQGRRQCAFTVTFAPTAPGGRSSLLTITDNAPGSPHTVALSGTGEGFTVAIASGESASATVAPGQTVKYSLSVAAAGGFNQSVAFFCTGAPSEATCSVSPSSFIPSGGSAPMLAVSITTTAASQTPPGPFTFTGHPFREGLWLIVLTILALWTFLSRRGRRARLALGACFIAVMLWAACGGGSTTSGGGNAGTPAGTYNLTVTGTFGSGTTVLSHSVMLTVKVS